MSARDDILARVRRYQPPAVALPEVPLFDSLVHDFKQNLERMGGEFAPSLDMRRRFPDARVIVSTVPEIEGNRPLPSDPRELADVAAAVAGARF